MVLVGQLSQGMGIWGAGEEGNGTVAEARGEVLVLLLSCESARQYLCSQGQAPAAIWWGFWLQTDVLIMNGEEGVLLCHGTL